MSCEHTGGLSHRALFYEAPDEFLACAGPFVREGLEREDAVVVVTSERNVGALRDHLGPADARQVDFRAPHDWYVTPARTLADYGRFVAAHDGPARIRVVGEAPFEDRSDRVLREWARADAVVNALLAQAPVDMICPYDLGALSGAIVERARRTHPHLCAGAEPAPNPDGDAEGFLRELDAHELEEPAVPVAELTFHDDPGPARRFVAEQASRVLHGERLEALRLAVSELATNAILHGHAPRQIRTWVEDHRVVCEIADAGVGIRSPLAGFVMPGTQETGGRGLWITRQVCDLVEIRGARVRLHMGFA